MMLLQIAAHTERAAELPGGYGFALLQGVVALLGVCVLAWVVLRWLARSGFGGSSVGGRRQAQVGAIRVIDRLVVGPRRELLVVSAGGKLLLLSGGDGVATTLLAELEPNSVAEAAPASTRRFRDLLRRPPTTGGG